MARQVIFVIGLVLAVAFNFVEGSLDQSNFAVNVVSDMDKFLNENPGVKAQPLIKQTRMAATPYAHLIYRIGGRVAGDRLLASDSKSQRFPNAQDVTQTLNYPRNGVGGVVTYLEIAVDQTSNLGRAYVVSGGVGQRQIAVVIEAKRTLTFTYRASVFGY